MCERVCVCLCMWHFIIIDMNDDNIVFKRSKVNTALTQVITIVM